METVYVQRVVNVIFRFVLPAYSHRIPSIEDLNSPPSTFKTGSERWVAPGIRYTMLGITHGRLALCYEQLNKIELYHTNISLATKFLSIGAKMNKATNSIISESQVRKWVDKMDKSLDPEWRRTKQ
jgi:hypothetical protein